MSSGTKSPIQRHQIHDGYATIRSRGTLNRTRSRAERKLFKDEPIYDSVPACKTTPSTQFSTFKPEYDYLPPLKSPQYITEMNTFRSDSPKISLYQRPASPAPPESPVYANWQTFAKFRDNSEEAEKPTFKKPPISYRKSFNVRERPFTRDYGVHLSSSDLSDISSSTSDGYSKIHKNASSELIHLTDSGYINGGRPKINHRYATLGHQPRKLPDKVGKSTGSLNECALDHNDILECKIGSQNTLRAKPKIPWYELAIKKENRQSCPAPFQQAHVVSAFEQSLSNMTSRLQQLTATTEKKESEILDMRQTIELLRKQSIQAGLTTAHMQSMGVQVNGQQPLQAQQQQQQQHQNHQQQQKHQKADTLPPLPPPNNGMQRHHSSDSMCSLNSISSGCSSQDKKKKKGWLRSSFTKAFSRNAKITKTNRHVSQASNLDSIAQSPQSQHGDDVGLNHQNQNSPKHSPHKTVTLVENAKPIDALDMDGNPIVQDLKKQLREKDLVLTDIRLEALSSASQLESLKDTVMKMRQEMINLKQNNERLQRLVTSRSLAGSEASLGGQAAVSPSGSAGESSRRFSLATDNGGVNSYARPVNTSAIEEMLETQLNEMLSILQPLELPKNLDETEEDNIPPAPAPDPPSVSPMTALSPTLDRRLGEEIMSTPAEEVADPVDGKKISIVVYLGQPDSFPKYAEELSECDNYGRYDDGEIKDQNMASKCPVVEPPSPNNEFVIAFTYISGKTTWQNLDYIVRKTFKDYLARIDPGGNLGLNTDSITSYHLGDAKRGPEMGYPELLPCGYIVGHVKSLFICLQGVGSLAFDTLIPRSIVHRYITLLTEHRRLILCGPSGTGKSYLARKLAEFLVAKSGKENPTEAIATFNVDHKSSKELQQYLSHIAEQASMSDGVSEELPSVIILDNLHHASELGDVFSCLLSAGPAAKLPCIIGTMSQATCNTTNLQLHHNFRWVLTANHMEPVKGFLARFLRRRLFTLELTTGRVQVPLEKVLRWLPTVWAHINGFLETHSSSDVTIGPRLFLACPLDMTDSQVWFTDVWNYHLAPYVMEAVREGVQLYGRRGATWTDPCTFVRETYPWPVGPSNVPTLRQITAEDVGLEQDVSGSSENQDPLLNMLMRLQEAANYNGNQEQDSDCASLDSNLTHDSSAGVD